MARMLSNLEYVTFLQDVQPDSLNLPAWGAVILWANEYVLAFKMPSGEWALTDITDGVPYGSTVIPVQQYLANVPRYQVSSLDVFVYSIPQSVAQSTLELAADLGALGSAVTSYTSEQVASAFQNLVGGLSTGLGPALLPLAAIALVVLVVMYGKK